MKIATLSLLVGLGLAASANASTCDTAVGFDPETGAHTLGRYADLIEQSGLEVYEHYDPYVVEGPTIYVMIDADDEDQREQLEALSCVPDNVVVQAFGGEDLRLSVENVVGTGALLLEGAEGRTEFTHCCIGYGGYDRTLSAEDADEDINAVLERTADEGGLAIDVTDADADADEVSLTIANIQPQTLTEIDANPDW